MIISIFMSTILFISAVDAEFTIRLEKDVPINQVTVVPNSITFNIYDSPVPESTKNWPNQTVTIKVQSDDNRLNNPKEVLFVTREEKWCERG